MKTKIIYISGSEIFEMSNIRAAFDEVRAALSLGNDTVLFGVPVDADCALADVQPTEANAPIAAVADDAPTATTTTDDAAPIIDDAPTIDAPAAPRATKKPRATKPKKAAKPVEDAPADDVAPAPIDVTDTTSAADEAPTNVVSILSVLKSKVPTESTDIETPAPVTTDAPAASQDTVPNLTDDAPVDTDVTETMADTPVEIDITQQVSVDDMITDDAPTAAPIDTDEKSTLEQLLEQMAPLREDKNEEHTATIDNDEDAPVDTISEFDSTNIDDDMGISDDTDATLAQLASEFAENQDKITVPQKTEKVGKIGKLKNILPFKKARRDDNSLMGDLFGWAGVAANDEDFAMPGFFTGVASKK